MISHLFLSCSILFLMSFSCCTDGIETTINLKNAAETGLIKIPINQKSDSIGVLRTFHLILPDYENGIYSAQDSFYEQWQINGNRVLPWYFTPKTLASLFTYPAYKMCKETDTLCNNISFKNKDRYISRFGCFLQLQLKDGRFLSILPLAGPETVTWLFVSEIGKLQLQIANYGTDSVSSQCPLLAWAYGDNLNESSYKLFQKLCNDSFFSKTLRMRYEKQFPKVFQYLGWCTWEEYKKDINDSILIKEIKKLKQLSLPIRYVIIDDGHLAFKESKADSSKGALSSFLPNEKFPNGFTQILNLREKGKLEWMGLWYNFNGYWGGFSPDNDFGDSINSHMEVIKPTGYYMPRSDSKAIYQVYNAMLKHPANDGFDFLKLDWQAANLYMYRFGKNAAKAAFNTSRIVDDIIHKYFGDAAINCMAMNNVVLQNTYHVNITRTSIDYKLNNLFMAKEHLRQSYGNALYMCPTVWGDHDMFHSSDKICGRIMALSKALSGGPIYLSDAPEHIDPQYVWPLCYSNGKLLRPLAPATVLQRSAFHCPLTDKTIYMVSAPLHNGAAAIVGYNLSIDSCTIQGEITATDYKMTGTLLQPYNGYWKIPEEGLYLYDYHYKKGAKLNSNYKFSISGFDDRYFLLLPIYQDWALIGCVNKYLAPETVSNVKYESNMLSFTLHEAGEVDFWLGHGTPISHDAKIIDLGEGHWRAVPHKLNENQIIHIYRK